MRVLPFASLLASLATTVVGQGPNLLQNSSFETGSLAPWSVVSGSVVIAPYGIPNIPDQPVAAATGGGGLLLRDGGSGIVEQVLAPSIPPGASLVVEGYLGGGLNDWTRLVVIARDAAGNQLDQRASDFVTDRQRNGEAVHLRRRIVMPTNALTVSFAVRIEFANQCCGAVASTADLVTATLVVGSTLPPPVTVGVELLQNPGFENGWIAGSPISLAGDAWEGSGSTASTALPYSTSNPNVPDGNVSCVVGGAFPAPSCTGGAAGNLLMPAGSDSALVQTLDLRGSTASFAGGGVRARLGAYLGGIQGQGDTARVELRFRNALGTVLQTSQVGPVSAAARNQESVLLRRTTDVVVPNGTAFADVVAVFTDVCCGGAFGTLDNISLQLLPSAPLPPIPLNVDLMPNASFESGSLPGTPLQLDAPNGWFGNGGGRMAVVQYGNPSLPPSTFANANSLGNLLLQDGGGSVLRAEVDLRGSATVVSSGTLAMQAQAWLGGIGAQGDTAEVRVSFETATGVATGAVTTLPPVTSTERQNQTTLLRRISAPFPVPTNAAKAIVQVVFTDVCCGGAFALADDVRLVAFDTAAATSALPYPGTDANALSLASGVDTLPQSGIGQTIKNATAGQVLRVRVGSPNGIADGSPMLLALEPFLTGTPPSLFLPDVWFDPRASLLIYNGLFGGFLAPVVVPMTQGGNTWAQLLPPGLGGVSLLLQAVAIDGASPNGFYFATDAHEIRVQ